MELIVLTHRQRVKRAVHLGGIGVAALGAAAVGLLGGAVWLGAELGRAAAPEPVPAGATVSMRRELADQRREVRRALGDARHDLDALALRLSELQARAIRIDALGSRLVELAGLDETEFSFGAPPPRGGPAPQDSALEPNRLPDFVADLERLERLLDLRAQELEALGASLVSARVARSLAPSGRPLDGGWISSSFGRRTDPLTGQRAMHYGVDFAGRRGSPIRAVAGGIVLFAGVRSGLGRVVEIDHGNGYVTRYAHNKKNLVTAGQRVAKGEHIALLGSTGRSTGDHVHFEVLVNGRHVNPMKYIRAADPKPGAGPAG